MIIKLFKDICTLLCLLLITPYSYAGVVFDGTMGKPGALTGPDYSITSNRGTIVGSNLFHSFKTFGLIRGESATFSGPDSVGNIISRVTGGAVSGIDGLIRSTIAGADMFLINPAGIIFGPNATLDVSGSFHVSTADYIKFPDGNIFSAANPEQSVLTAAPVSAFGFIKEVPAPISVNGSGSFKAEHDYNLKGLYVPQGKEISLIGGHITLASGLLDGLYEVESRISAPGGRINMVSLASPGEVIPGANGMDASSFSQFGNIDIIKGSRVSVSDTRAGAVYIRGGNFIIDSNNLSPHTDSTGGIYANSWGDATGGGVDINMSGDLIVSNNAGIFSGIYGAGTGPDITIEANNIMLSGGGSISAISYDAGRGGSINIAASDFVFINGYDNLSVAGGIFAEAYGTGDSGGIFITAPRIEIDYGGYISASTGYDSAGRGGSININASDYAGVKGGAYIMAESQGSGDGGDINIAAPRLELSDRGGVSVSTLYGKGRGGSININASDYVRVMQDAYITAETYGTGDGGGIFITAPRLTISDLGYISASTGYLGAGRGGSINITASDFVNISGTGISGDTGIYADTGGRGDCGDIIITTPRLTVSNGGFISASTGYESTGKGGSINISASEYAEIIGDSAVLARSEGSGAGNIFITTPVLAISNGGGITATTFSTGKGGSISISASDYVEISGVNGDNRSFVAANSQGSGDGGNIFIATPVLSISNGGYINASAYSSGKGGSINIVSSDYVEISGADSGYRTFVAAQSQGSGDGGNIFVTTPDLIISDGGGITATAYGNGNGGSVNITGSRLTVMDGGHISASTGKDSAGKGGSIDIAASDYVEIKGVIGGERSFIAVESQGAGDGGNISITTPGLTIREGGIVTATAFSTGKGGSIDIVASDYVEIRGVNSDNRSCIAAESQGAGDGGNIHIAAQGLTVSDGGYINASAYNSGKGGSINITASDFMDVKGVIGGERSFIAVESQGSGDGGNISITTPGLTIREGSGISATAYSTGNAGSINVTSTGFLDINGMNTGIFAGTSGSGRGGNIFVNAPGLSMSNSGEIGASTSLSGSGGDIHINTNMFHLDSGAQVSSESTGTGTAGDINIRTDYGLYMDHGKITTATANADGGNIGVLSGYLIDMIGSDITATVAGGTGNGGNIYMKSRNIVVDPSRIIAKAEYGKGGNILIICDAFIMDPQSIISASSTYGNQGTVNVNSPVVDLIGNLIVTPGSFLDADTLSPKKCIPQEAEDISTFRITGREGLPPPPDYLMPER